MMKLVCIRNPLSRKDLVFEEVDVQKYFSLYYYALFFSVFSFHFADTFQLKYKMSVLLLSIVVPSIVIPIFLNSKSMTLNEDQKWESLIYTSLPALLVIYSSLIFAELISSAYNMYWG